MLIYGVIYDFPYQMVQSRRTRTADIHAGPFAYCNQTFEHLDVVSIVSSAGSGAVLGDFCKHIDLFEHSCSSFFLYLRNANKRFGSLCTF
ncbi:hypothetical protein D3C87_1761960 [compost metagenome]